jgi:hypothetical protein
MSKYIWIGFLFIMSCGQEVPIVTISQYATDTVAFRPHPGDYYAGDQIILIADIIDNQSIDSFLVIFTYSLGESILKVKPESDSLVITVPDEISTLRGAVYISLMRGGHTTASTSFHIKPLQPFEQIASYGGPATIESSGIDWHLITTIPKDPYGNPVADGTEVDFSLLYPGGAMIQRKEKVESLLTGIRINSITKAGKIYIGAKSGTAHAVEREVLVTPTWPTNFELEVLEFFPIADQRQVVRLRTSIILDRFGNTIADGTIINFVKEEDKGRINNYVSFTVSGRAEVQIENPNYETIWEVYAFIDQSVKSETKKLYFQTGDIEIPIAYVKQKRSFRIGPITGLLNQFVPNGTNIEIEFKGPNVLKYYSGEINNGYYEWYVPTTMPGPNTFTMKVSIGDHQKTVEFKIN